MHGKTRSSIPLKPLLDPQLLSLLARKHVNPHPKALHQCVRMTQVDRTLARQNFGQFGLVADFWQIGLTHVVLRHQKCQRLDSAHCLWHGVAFGLIACHQIPHHGRQPGQRMRLICPARVQNSIQRLHQRLIVGIVGGRC